ncbi:MAG TPA: hypothetical protein VF597_03310 [Candidatus Saccharimonadales bacterium]|jgi:hypothetical protein
MVRTFIAQSLSQIIVGVDLKADQLIEIRLEGRTPALYLLPPRTLSTGSRPAGWRLDPRVLSADIEAQLLRSPRGSFAFVTTAVPGQPLMVRVANGWMTRKCHFGLIESKESKSVNPATSSTPVGEPPESPHPPLK